MCIRDRWLTLRISVSVPFLFSGGFPLLSLQPCLMVFDQRLHVGIGILFCNIQGPCVIFFAELDDFNLLIQKLLDLGEELFFIFTAKRKRNALMDLSLIHISEPTR